MTDSALFFKEVLVKGPFKRMDSPGLRRILVAIATAIDLAACSEQPPRIARGLPRNTAAFNETVINRFSVGSDEQKLTAELHRERFSVTEIRDPATQYRYSARYDAHDVVCKDVWTILWSAEAGKITKIEGRTGSVCL